MPPGQKSPPPKGYTGNGRPYPNDIEVAKWLAEQPTGNIALRLSEVPQDKVGTGRPAVYAGNTVDGWELIGLDVDDYPKGEGVKRGGETLTALIEELGPLPATAMSSARYADWNAHRSSIRVFLVPKGFRYMAEAGPNIDIIQKRHRFMVAPPSTNPDAPKVGGKPAIYEWRWGTGEMTYDELEKFEADGKADEAGAGKAGAELVVPSIADDVAVLPEEWFLYLSRNAQIETDDPISSLGDDALMDWATTELRWEGEPCRRLAEAVETCIAELNGVSDSHPPMTNAIWHLLNSAAEGHSGLHQALLVYGQEWQKHVLSHRGGDPNDISAEYGRSIVGALSKIEPKYALDPNQTTLTVGADTNHLPLADDTCEQQEQVKNGEWDERLNNWSKLVESRIAEHDFGGWGPVVGQMEMLNAKPADEYGEHQDGNADHFIDLYGGNVKYVEGRENWVMWSAGRWHRDNSGAEKNVGNAFRRVRLRQMARARELTAEAQSADERGNDAEAKALKARAKSLAAFAKRNGDYTQKAMSLKSAHGLWFEGEPVALKADMFDRNPALLGCANGLLYLGEDDPENIDIRQPVKNDYVTFNTRVDYVPWRKIVNYEDNTRQSRGYELWNSYLDRFLPDLEMRRIVRKVLGHCLIGGNPEKKIVFLYGQANTGKSTLLGAVKGALGDYYGTIDMKMFKQKDLNPGLANALPLRVAGMSEVEDKTKQGVLDPAMAKRLSGNDEVSVELKYSNETITGRPQFTAVIACNNPPTITGADKALYDRLLVLPLDMPMPKSEQKFDRQMEIEEECGWVVLSWLIEGWKDYRREGLDESNWPESMKVANATFASELNNAQRYIEEYLDIAQYFEGGRVLADARDKALRRGKVAPTPADWPLEWTPLAAKVYNHYSYIVKGQGGEPVDMQQFTRDLGCGRTVMRKIDGKAQSVYTGVRFKDEEDSAGTIMRKW